MQNLYTSTCSSTQTWKNISNMYIYASYIVDRKTTTYIIGNNAMPILTVNNVNLIKVKLHHLSIIYPM
jgi:hypothetical protein